MEINENSRPITIKVKASDLFPQQYQYRQPNYQNPLNTYSNNHQEGGYKSDSNDIYGKIDIFTFGNNIYNNNQQSYQNPLPNNYPNQQVQNNQYQQQNYPKQKNVQNQPFPQNINQQGYPQQNDQSNKYQQGGQNFVNQQNPWDQIYPNQNEVQNPQNNKNLIIKIIKFSNK